MRHAHLHAVYFILPLAEAAPRKSPAFAMWSRAGSISIPRTLRILWHALQPRRRRGGVEFKVLDHHLYLPPSLRSMA